MLGDLEPKWAMKQANVPFATQYFICNNAFKFFLCAIKGNLAFRDCATYM